MRCAEDMGKRATSWLTSSCERTPPEPANCQCHRYHDDPIMVIAYSGWLYLQPMCVFGAMLPVSSMHPMAVNLAVSFPVLRPPAISYTLAGLESTLLPHGWLLPALPHYRHREQRQVG